MMQEVTLIVAELMALCGMCGLVGVAAGWQIRKDKEWRKEE